MINTDKGKIIYQRGKYYIHATPFPERICFDVREKNPNHLNNWHDNIKKTYIGWIDHGKNFIDRFLSRMLNVDTALDKSLKYLDKLYNDDIKTQYNLEYTLSLIDNIREGLQLKQEAYDIIEKELKV